jgi:Txe/YoeB family toxin of toxin-antitoxin system
MWTLKFAQVTKRQAKEIRKTNFAKKVSDLLDILSDNPFKNPPPYEKLNPLSKNRYSRRINSQHRIVYEVDKDKQIVTVLSLWTHYE